MKRRLFLKVAGESVFLKEESQVAMGSPCHQPVFPDSPHECGWSCVQENA
jgi:hypothetical protein